MFRRFSSDMLDQLLLRWNTARCLTTLQVHRNMQHGHGTKSSHFNSIEGAPQSVIWNFKAAREIILFEARSPLGNLLCLSSNAFIHIYSHLFHLQRIIRTSHYMTITWYPSIWDPSWGTRRTLICPALSRRLCRTRGWPSQLLTRRSCRLASDPIPSPWRRAESSSNDMRHTDLEQVYSSNYQQTPVKLLA